MRPNILVVCGKNKRRSRTAEYIFKNDQRFAIRSAGLSPKSSRQLSADDLEWADAVLVMETDHRKRIWTVYQQLRLPPIEVLDIPDEYEFMDDELIKLLSDTINDSLKNRFEI